MYSRTRSCASDCLIVYRMDAIRTLFLFEMSRDSVEFYVANRFA